MPATSKVLDEREFEKKDHASCSGISQQASVQQKKNQPLSGLLVIDSSHRIRFLDAGGRRLLRLLGEDYAPVGIPLLLWDLCVDLIAQFTRLSLQVGLFEFPPMFLGPLRLRGFAVVTETNRPPFSLYLILEFRSGGLARRKPEPSSAYQTQDVQLQ